MPKEIEFISRFLAKIRKSSDCWEWLGAKNIDGYGRFLVGSRRDGSRKNATAHRLMWEFASGKIPKGLQVLHRCDNPACVRPSHLWLGTQLDNIKDRDHKRRHWAHRGTWKKPNKSVT